MEATVIGNLTSGKLPPSAGLVKPHRRPREDSAFWGRMNLMCCAVAQGEGTNGPVSQIATTPEEAVSDADTDAIDGTTGVGLFGG
jgi:hypothetical protein